MLAAVHRRGWERRSGTKAIHATSSIQLTSDDAYKVTSEVEYGANDVLDGIEDALHDARHNVEGVPEDGQDELDSTVYEVRDCRDDGCHSCLWTSVA